MRVVIAEDSGMLRQLLAETLTGRGLTVVGQVGTATELPDVVHAATPDVVIVDIRLPPNHRDDGLRAAEEVHARCPLVGILVLSHYAETSYASRVLEISTRGVGYLVKDRVQDLGRLIDAIKQVAAGEVVVDSEVVRQVMLRPRVTDPLRHLSTGERQLLALMAQGRSNSAIARELSYSLKTVEKTITGVLQKLGLPHPGSAERADVNPRVLAVLTYLRRLGEAPP